MAPPVCSLLGGDLGPRVLPGVAATVLVQRRCCSEGGDWHRPGDPGVLQAGGTGQRALATPAQGRAPGSVLRALPAFLLLVLSPPSILTPHWPLVALPRLGPGGCRRFGWCSRQAGSDAAGSTEQDGRPSFSRLSARKRAREQSPLTEQPVGRAKVTGR